MANLRTNNIIPSVKITLVVGRHPDESQDLFLIFNLQFTIFIEFFPPLRDPAMAGQ